MLQSTCTGIVQNSHTRHLAYAFYVAIYMHGYSARDYTLSSDDYSDVAIYMHGYSARARITMNGFLPYSCNLHARV